MDIAQPAAFVARAAVPLPAHPPPALPADVRRLGADCAPLLSQHALTQRQAALLLAGDTVRVADSVTLHLYERAHRVDLPTLQYDLNTAALCALAPWLEAAELFERVPLGAWRIWLALPVYAPLPFAIERPPASSHYATVWDAATATPEHVLWRVLYAAAVRFLHASDAEARPNIHMPLRARGFDAGDDPRAPTAQAMLRAVLAPYTVLARAVAVHPRTGTGPDDVADAHDLSAAHLFEPATFPPALTHLELCIVRSVHGSPELSMPGAANERLLNALAYDAARLRRMERDGLLVYVRMGGSTLGALFRVTLAPAAAVHTGRSPWHAAAGAAAGHTRPLHIARLGDALAALEPQHATQLREQLGLTIGLDARHRHVVAVEMGSQLRHALHAELGTFLRVRLEDRMTAPRQARTAVPRGDGTYAPLTPRERDALPLIEQRLTERRELELAQVYEDYTPTVGRRMQLPLRGERGPRLLMHRALAAWHLVFDFTLDVGQFELRYADGASFLLHHTNDDARGGPFSVAFLYETPQIAAEHTPAFFSDGSNQAWPEPRNRLPDDPIDRDPAASAAMTAAPPPPLTATTHYHHAERAAFDSANPDAYFAKPATLSGPTHPPLPPRYPAAWTSPASPAPLWFGLYLSLVHPDPRMMHDACEAQLCIGDAAHQLAASELCLMRVVIQCNYRARAGLPYVEQAPLVLHFQLAPAGTASTVMPLAINGYRAPPPRSLLQFPLDRPLASPLYVL
ncbi:MAG: hypothetical protein EPO08_21165 [Rhodospirillaceae bacterium]|nr:MAG: hypothetical protein EPO08_21165 [Rhodospirillaceae bacterium]